MHGGGGGRERDLGSGEESIAKGLEDHLNLLPVQLQSQVLLVVQWPLRNTIQTH